MSQRGPMRCADAASYLSAFVDGELTEPLREQIAAHVAGCAACARKVARYRQTKQLLGTLPRTAPSPEVFDRILSALPERYPEAAARESLGGVPRDSSLRRRLAALEQPALDDERITPFPARASWARRALPVVAAVLLISMTLLAFSHFSSAFNRPVTRVPTPTAAPVYAATQAEVEGLRRQLAFDPVLPQYLPEEAQLVRATVGQGGAGAYLDVTWNFPAAAFKVHVRESPGAQDWPGYSPAPPDPDLSWQLSGSQPWLPLLRAEGARTTAIGQSRVTQNHVNMSIAMDVDVDRNNLRSYGQARAMLRKLSLSMDLPYRPVTILGGDAAQLQRMTLHYTMVGRASDGRIAWSAEGYLDRTNQRQRIEVTAASGTRLYTDVISGDSVLRLDRAHGTFQRTSLAALRLGSWANGPASDQRFFLFANSYVDAIDLWNTGTTGTTRYQGRTVYDMELVSAPSPTHVYVDTASQHVMAVVAEAQSPLRPGGPAAVDPFGPPVRCASYTLLTYLEPGAVPRNTFDSAVPSGSGYSAGNVPQTVAC
jgi:anti-sigma factor RsiW